MQDLGRPVAYYPSLNKLTGSVTATIFLCQFVYWHGKGADPEWIYKTQAEIQEETGLSRREQETARRNLKEIGVLEEKYKGIPRKLYYRLDIDKFNELWHSIMAESDIMERRNPPDSNGGNSQTITETTQETTQDISSAPAEHVQQPKKTKRSDPLFEAIAEAWRGEPYREDLLNELQAPVVGKAAAALRKIGARPEDVPLEWKQLTERFDNPTPLALAKHWGTNRAAKPRPMTGAELYGNLEDNVRLWNS